MHVLSCLRNLTSISNRAPCFSLRIMKFSYKTPIRNRIGTKNPILKDEGMKIAPIKEVYETPREYNMLPGLLKSVLFTAGLCGTLYVGAAIFQYERIQRKFKGGFNIWVADKWNQVEGWENKEGDLRQSMNRWWNSIPEGEKVFWGIFAVNAMVIACWQVPAFKPIMLRYFTSSPAAKAVCWPMLLSAFSHYSLLHFGCNMYVLHSFCGPIGQSLGREQLLAFYCSGGLISAIASQTAKILSRSVGPSLGASGAILAVVGYFCMIHPNAELGIIFIPGLNFSAENAIKGVMALDVAGLLFRWKLFDHAGHLGGALFGVLYAKYGEQFIWSKRTPVIEQYRAFRKEYVDAPKPKPPKR